MSEKVADLVKAVLELSREEQADFLDAYQIARCRGESGLPFDPEWLDEIDRRSEAYERGEMKSYTWDEVKARLNQRIKSGE